MSLLTREGRITFKTFALVTTLANLPEIQQQPGTVSNISSLQGADNRIDLAEGCILTKSVKYTHQLAHWVNAVHSGDPKEVEDVIEFDLKIVPYQDFSLEDPCNLAYLEASVHTSLDLYAFIALTASSSTLCDLIKMVKVDNDRRQKEMDESGYSLRRMLNFDSPSFTNPEYELVAIHPEHFLPCHSILPVFHSGTSTHTLYVSAEDRRLRESPKPDSPPLPTFHHAPESRSGFDCLNIFLVILNAEIKFHRYLRMISEDPPTTPLPDDVLNLMELTVKLVHLLYWMPVPTKGSPGEAEFTKMSKIPGFRSNLRHKRKYVFPADMDLEARKAYGRALMSGHDRDYDPALFENAIPIDGTKPISEKVNVEAWRQNIGSET